MAVRNREDRQALSYIGGEFHKLNARLDRIERIMKAHFRFDVEEAEMAQADIDALRAEVARNTDVDAAALALIKGIVDKLKAIPDPSPEVRALTADLARSTDALAAAVVENTEPPF